VKDNQLLLPNGKLITFNNEQTDALNKIKHWLMNGDLFFTLSGYAGTGKSTILKKILDNYNGNVVVSAPTHKAKKVIANVTGKRGQTLHSLLGLRPDVNLDDFNPNDPQFNPIAEPKITDFSFVVIDEASMINQELYKLIHSNVLNSKTKVLFVGDPAQIPPVGEKESVVFNQEMDDKTYHHLSKIERQNDTNPITFVYDALRNNLNKLDGGFKRISNINDNGEGIVFLKDKRKFRNLILEKFKDDEFKKDTDFCKVIAWKNDTVMKSNSIIRKELLGDKSDVIEVNDIIMGYRSISNESQKYNIIENSADYHVVGKSNLEENRYEILGYRVKLRETLGKGLFNFQDVFIIDSNNHDNLHKYAEMHDFLRDISKTNKKFWSKYYDFRRENLLMKTITEYRNGDKRSGYDVIIKDLDYGYAITGHKSQGSTYTHVFVMENDINDNWLLKERNQIKYVALTRPTISATVLIN